MQAPILWSLGCRWRGWLTLHAAYAVDATPRLQVTEPTNAPNSRAVALAHSVGASAPATTLAPAAASRTGTVTSISSASSSPPPGDPAAVPRAGPSGIGDVSSAVPVNPSPTVGPLPESMLLLHSVKAGLGPREVLEALREVVPARAVLGVRPAKAAETEGQADGALVAEFTSASLARWVTRRGPRLACSGQEGEASASFPWDRERFVLGLRRVSLCPRCCAAVLW